MRSSEVRSVADRYHIGYDRRAGESVAPVRVEVGVEFLVQVEVRWPPDGDPVEKTRLVAAESDRARELIADGRIRRLWRIPGRWANYGVWHAADATELHAVLSSLPLYAWCDIEVKPLAVHPSDPGP